MAVNSKCGEIRKMLPVRHESLVLIPLLWPPENTQVQASPIFKCNRNYLENARPGSHVVWAVSSHYMVIAHTCSVSCELHVLRDVSTTPTIASGLQSTWDKNQPSKKPSRCHWQMIVWDRTAWCAAGHPESSVVVQEGWPRMQCGNSLAQLATWQVQKKSN